ncbi:hypothetical protein EXIGLDRAFT_716572 [Exidia glandulosa HHB12029]|uniref:Uncharacterized protein n=1 Tax=Exidia glandulosa HHB12029 TaxID=1314781 RepID=A0A165IVQ2_EXIGL|nr:hypothetical protein EXIGLDRAFT_716572 [Exidia glandulosa HHB12029]
MGSVGSIAGVFVGNVDVTRALPPFGSTQIDVLSVLSARSPQSRVQVQLRSRRSARVSARILSFIILF